MLCASQPVIVPFSPYCGHDLDVLGWNLALAAVFLVNGEAAYRAGVDDGARLMARQIRENAKRQSDMEKSFLSLPDSIITPPRQLVLPGIDR